MSRALLLLLVLASADARAEAPWRIAIGGGPAFQRVTGGMVSPDFKLGASARLDAGYHVLDSTAVGATLGAHLGIGYVRAHEVDLARYIDVDTTYFPFEVGVGAQLVIADRLLIAPWIGMLDLKERRFHAGGVGLGFDVDVRGHDRITAMATFTRAPGDHGDSFNSVGVGVGYRYW
jgi:hypothetical protein